MRSPGYYLDPNGVRRWWTGSVWGHHPAPPADKPGYYTDPGGARRWWDGRAWGRTDDPIPDMGMCGTDNWS